MNTLFIWGPILDKTGLAMWHRSSGRTDIEACPVDGGLADEQASLIPVFLRHRGPTIGEVLGIEHVYDQVMVLAEVDVDRVDPHDLPPDAESAAWFWSASIKRGRGSTAPTVRNGSLTEVSLTTAPASLLRPVRATRNLPTRRSLDQWQQRAADTIEQRRGDRQAPLRIQHFDQRGKPVTQHPAVHRAAVHRGAGQRGADGIVWQHSAHVGPVLSVTR